MFPSRISSLLLVLGLSHFESSRIYADARCEDSNDTMDVPLITSYHLRTGKLSPLLLFNDDSFEPTKDEDSQTEPRVPCAPGSASLEPTSSSTPGPSSVVVSPTPWPTTPGPSLFPTISQGKSDSPSANDHQALSRNVDEGKRPQSLEVDGPNGIFGVVFFIALVSVMAIALFVSPKVESPSDYEESQNTSLTECPPQSVLGVTGE